ncbi:MAG: TetR family transcriptional regulator C-terminal domain-containing protein [Acidimicrobiales bacterium]|jgi:AcrR family transcriptional regulator
MTPRAEAPEVGGRVRESTEAPASQDARRSQMLRAALDVLVERGFPDTRIADVAERAEVSPALVIYYFKTKDRLLTEAMRFAEDLWYADGARRLAALPTAAKRLEEIVAMTCLTQEHHVEESWAIWLDLWATAVRHPEVRRVREEFDEHWRETIRRIVREGQSTGEFSEVDVEDFAVALSALLDGFAIQIALDDPVVDERRAFDLTMRLAAAQLGFAWDARSRPSRKKRAR